MSKVDLTLAADQFFEKYGRKKSISAYTLGCKVNQYETQALKEKFIKSGYEVVEEGQFADVYMINTCTVTGLSDKKSRQFIRRVKRINPDSITAVVGCYAQVNPEEAAAIPGVNIIAGTNEKNKLVEYIETYLKNQYNMPKTHVLPLEALNEYVDTDVITAMDSRTRAYIKVQDGCNRFCSYCIIPYARGDVRSRNENEILDEAKSLLSQGFKELVLTGVNTALYGRTAHSEGGDSGAHAPGEKTPHGLSFVLQKLNDLTWDFRIRIGSLEPTVVNKEYAVDLLKYDKLCHHFHLSLQSGSDKILKEMNRNYTGAEFCEIVFALRAKNPNFGITTDIIVGFPGETDEDFEASVKIVETLKFSKVHVFKYSKRQGTKAADMKEHISPKIKDERSKKLIIAGNKAAKNFFEDNINKESKVLFEKKDSKTGLAFGHSDNYIPVYCSKEVELNRFYDVRLMTTFNQGMMVDILD